MAPSHRRGRATLSQSLDREVNQVVRKIIDERTQFDTAFRPTYSVLYDEIKRSNSSLNRKPKKLLEDSIERVLDVIRQDDVDSDSEMDIELEPVQSKPRSNGLNKSIVAAWSRGASTPAKEDAVDLTKSKDESMEVNATKSDQPNGEPPRKKRKRTTAADYSPPTDVSLWDLGGVDDVVRQFKDLLYPAFLRPETIGASKMQPIRGILIHGPPGCGKTTIARAIAAAFSVSFIEISAPSVVSGMSGESEKALRERFEEAKTAAPCILFIDEIDAITPKRENSERQMEKRIVAQLGTCMDDLSLSKTDNKPILVFAATNRPDSLDPALRRGGRFDKEINMSVPNQAMRHEILKSLTRTYPLSEDIDLLTLAKRTPGFVGADLRDLVVTACNSTFQRIQEADITAAIVSTAPPGSSMQTPEPESATASLFKLIDYCRTNPPPPTPLLLTQADFLLSLPKIHPSALREGFATVPTTTFSSIGALAPLITQLTETIINPILTPHLYSSIGNTPVSGCLLFGPPGCGKTLLAKAVANASAANFISVKGPELLNKYVGESERAVRQVFARARSSVPVIIFLDELDALTPKRDSASNDASSRVVNTLLTELDGAGDSRDGIYVIAATNRPDIIDAAMLRPGRLESLLYVGLPDPNGRVEILKALTSKMRGFVFDAELEALVREKCNGFSGADLESWKKMAGYEAVRRYTREKARTSSAGISEMETEPTMTISTQDFAATLAQMRRSVSDKDVQRYERMRTEWQKV
jgi:ribosome biogenesis ATPase